MNINYDPFVATSLCKIMGKYGSDKGHEDIIKSWHNYTTYYSSLFASLKNSKIRLFELGLGTNNTNIPSNMGANGKPGASLYGWAEYFENAEIFGADIDKDILFNTDKIHTFYCDQTNSQIIKNMWNSSELLENFDIIIDDGLHTFSANMCFFENSIHKLNKNGYYIIEDILKEEESLFINQIELWKISYPNLVFEFVKLPSQRNIYDNSLLVIHKI